MRHDGFGGDGAGVLARVSRLGFTEHQHPVPRGLVPVGGEAVVVGEREGPHRQHVQVPVAYPRQLHGHEIVLHLEQGFLILYVRL